VHNLITTLSPPPHLVWLVTSESVTLPRNCFPIHFPAAAVALTVFVFALWSFCGDVERWESGLEGGVAGRMVAHQVYLHMLASDNKLPRCHGATHALCQRVRNEQRPTRIIKRFPQRAIKSPEQFNSIYTWRFRTQKKRHREENFMLNIMHY